MRVTVECDEPGWYPLAKTKFDGFNSCMVSPDRYERTVDFLSDLALDTVRIDGGMGAPFSGWGEPPVSATADGVDYGFATVNALLDSLRAAGVAPYWSYEYTPPFLQPDGGDHRSPPVDGQAWGAIVRAYAAHFRETGRQVRYHEIWNEPDLDLFFTGTLDDYLGLYRRGVENVRAGDPDALVGGPALAGSAWDEAFLTFVADDDLPLDFFSFHQYGTDYGHRIRAVQERLDSDERFDTTELHLNEYNPTTNETWTGGGDGSLDRYPMAARLLADFKELLSFPALTKVHWAQLHDPGPEAERIGVIDLDGRRKAAYDAWHAYARMPVDSCRLAVDGPDGHGGLDGVDGLASTDGRRVGVLVWNLSGTDHRLATDLSNVPFATGRVRVYRIDWGAGQSAGGGLRPSEGYDDVAVKDFSWKGSLPAGGVVYLELDSAERTASSPPETRRDVADVVHVEHHYPDRERTSFAQFDHHTWTARLGTMTEADVQERVGVTAENWPWGLLIDSETASLGDVSAQGASRGVRLDYRVDGEYTRAVLVRPPDQPTGRFTPDVPWGTTRPPDEVVAVGSFSEFVLVPGLYAPVDWDGRAVLSFVLGDAPRLSRWTVTVRPFTTDMGPLFDGAFATRA